MFECECVVQISRPVPEWDEHFPGRDVKSPGKWDAEYHVTQSSSQNRPIIPSIPRVRTHPNFPFIDLDEQDDQAIMLLQSVSKNMEGFTKCRERCKRMTHKPPWDT